MTMRNRFLQSVYREAPGEGAPGAAPAADPKPGDAAPKSEESILFPNEGGDPKPGDKPAADAKDGDAPKPDDKPADWKEYVADPKKSEAENAAAKAEHDKTKPADPNDPANVVPADGKYALVMPDGIKLDEELLGALGPKFAAKKMTNAEAQELANEFIKVQTARETKRGEAWTETVNGWIKQAETDKEIGGDKWEGSKRDALAAVKAYGTPELKQYFIETGGGNHPELIRFMARVGKTISEDSPPSGGSGGTGTPAEPAHVLFPNDKPKG